MKNQNYLKLIDFDRSFLKDGEFIAGIDEAGRGALFGPVVAAVVVLKVPEPEIEGINDSKKIPEKKRYELFKKITNVALEYHVGIRNSWYIDRYNIYYSTRMAMIQAIKALRSTPKVYIFDYMKFSGIDAEVYSFAKADSKSYVVACASIVAKVTRDEIIKKMAILTPNFSLEKHKGYGTKAHIEEIKQYGPTKYHRFSFKGVRR